MHKLNADTQAHINKVRRLLRLLTNAILERGETHDVSKFAPEEADVFDEYSPKLSAVTYGSEEYKSFLVAMKPALDHHYANNRHHPEHFEHGIDGMNLVDLVEMFIDWTASSQRHDDGNIHRSIETNAKRFGMSNQLVNIFQHTARDLGAALEIPNQYHKRCKTCAFENWPNETMGQCALTSAPVMHYDSCEAWKETTKPEGSES